MHITIVFLFYIIHKFLRRRGIYRIVFLEVSLKFLVNVILSLLVTFVEIVVIYYYYYYYYYYHHHHHHHHHYYYLALQRTNPTLTVRAGLKRWDSSAKLQYLIALLTFKPDFELTISRFVVWIVVKGCAVHDPRSPVKLCPVFVIANNRQISVTVVIKLRRFPRYNCLHLCCNNILIWWTIYNLWA